MNECPAGWAHRRKMTRVPPQDTAAVDAFAKRHDRRVNKADVQVPVLVNELRMAAVQRGMARANRR